MVSLVARRHGVSPNQLFHWCKLGLDGALTATRADEEVVPASQYKGDEGDHLRSPQSNGMTEAFVKTFKRDYVEVNPTPDAQTVINSLPKWFEHYNNCHPHSALKYCSPREFTALKSTS